jgi:GNAT superfamily N-acetyltransferase
MEIRDATPQDWPLIYPFWSQIVEEGETYAYPLGLGLEEARGWWMEQPPGRTVVAVADGEVVGSAKMGPNRPGRGAHVATASFMVDPRRRRRGVGRALGEHVIQWAGDSGFHSIQFNAVVQVNTAAVRLWEELGFVIIGTVPEAFDHQSKGRVGLHVMVRKQ